MNIFRRSLILLKDVSRTKNVLSLYPAISAEWSMQKNKLWSPRDVDPNSTRKVWWNCTKCSHLYARRVRDQVKVQGCCPSCHHIPKLHTKDAHKTSAMLNPCEQRRLKPMLAQSWSSIKDRLSDKEELFVSPKLDGVRCIIGSNLVTGQPFFLSRNGTELECCDHLLPQIRHLLSLDPELTLDGELYNHEFSSNFDTSENFDTIISAVRVSRLRATAQHRRLQSRLQYHVFDVMYSKKLRERSPFEQRFERLKQLLAKPDKRKTEGLVLVPQRLVLKSQIDGELQQARKEHYEGIMVRSKDGPYEFGKRSVQLLKCKEMLDSEYEIVDAIEGQGKWTGMLGSFLCTTKEGLIFSVSPSVTEEMRRDLWQRRQSLNGKALTVQYQSTTKLGVPRFPIGKCIRGTHSGTDWV